MDGRYARPAVIGAVLARCRALPGPGLHHVITHDCEEGNGKEEKFSPIPPSEDQIPTTAKEVEPIHPDQKLDEKLTQDTAMDVKMEAMDVDEVKNLTHDSTQENYNKNVDEKTVVPAVVCNAGVVKLLRFRPLVCSSTGICGRKNVEIGDIFIPKDGNCKKSREIDGNLKNSGKKSTEINEDFKNLQEERKDYQGSAGGGERDGEVTGGDGGGLVEAVAPGEEVLMMDTGSVALSARQDIRIRHELCCNDSLRQLLTVHSLPHQPAF
ncbi:uncharacterized protein LOC108668882 [Hyalella azteca]|uniref:Uncharacterized protein LOC108668882 n=1 Tax=Hyalella azteca TaxID=294128 RepID=A0A8B7NDE8_HYAAZ|nr:uncharacterized protein LOC108668882 [Hyalella azteca]